MIAPFNAVTAYGIIISEKPVNWKGVMMNKLITQWHEQGYISVKNLLNKNEVKQLLDICNRIKKQFDENNQSASGETFCMRHLNHPDYYINHKNEYEIFMNTICHEKILNIVNQILNQKSMFRTTSYFFEPKSGIKDGNWHRDTQFIYKDEAREKVEVLKAASQPAQGIQLQIALEPSDDIEYVPYSHKRWDTTEEYQIRLKDNQINNRSNAMPNAVRFHQEPGDMVAFDSNGLHRGRYHSDKIRRTLMLTYSSKPYFDYFTDQPWFLTDQNFKNLPLRTQEYFHPFIETFRPKWEEKIRSLTNS